MGPVNTGERSGLKVPDPAIGEVVKEILEAFRKHGPGGGGFVAATRHIHLTDKEAVDALAWYSSWASSPENSADSAPWEKQDIPEDRKLAVWLLEVLMLISKLASATGRKVSPWSKE